MVLECAKHTLMRHHHDPVADARRGQVAERLQHPVAEAIPWLTAGRVDDLAPLPSVQLARKP